MTDSIIKRTLAVVLVILFFATDVYVEGNGFEPHQLLIGLMAIAEVVFIFLILRKFDKYVALRKLSVSKKTLFTTIICVGMIVTVLAVDSAIRWMVTKSGKDYSTTWMVTIPVIVVLGHLFGVLDIWALDREKRSGE